MFLDKRCNENAQTDALSPQQAEEAAQPRVSYCKYKDKRLEQDEEWHRTGVNRSWQVWKWDHIQDELILTTKKSFLHSFLIPIIINIIRA